MLEHLKEYTINEIKNRFVILEKKNNNLIYFLESIEHVGWTNIIFCNKRIILMTNEKTKQIILVSISPYDIYDLKNPFCRWGIVEIEKKQISIHMAVIFEVKYSEDTKNFKVPDFIKWYTSIISFCEEEINNLNKIMKEFESGCITFSFFTRQIDLIKIELDRKKQELTKSFHEKFINDFFA